mgnify:CR=1 FL=1|jgi:RimJ/RimL family protein N-acetyltransferase
MTKLHTGTISSSGFSLRPICDDDLPTTLQWRNKKRIRPWFKSSEAITPIQHRNWFRDYLTRDDDLVYIIEENDVAVGQISLYNINRSDNSAEFGRLMIGDDRALGKGVARDSAALLVTFAMEQLGITTIYLEVLKNNAPAIRIYEAVGFKEEQSRDDTVLKMWLRAAHD